MESGVYIWLFIIFSLKIPWSGCSVYSGTENICSIRECTCVYSRVECACTHSSSFQESFQFRDDSRKLEELVIQNCSKLVFPTQAISAESYLTQIYIKNVSQVELQPESISVSRLKVFNVSFSGSVVFHQQSFKSFITDSPTVRVNLVDVEKVSIKPKAFASIRSLLVKNVEDLQLEPLALKLKVPTLEPTIEISFINISTKSLASSLFSSSFKHILLEDCRVDKIQSSAFSGFLMNTVTLRRVSINRIERGAFSDQSVIENLNIEACNISSMSQKSIVAGISRLNLTQSVIQSMSKYGAMNVTVANVYIVNNTFRTLGEESLNFISWNSVEIRENLIEFLEEGAINAIHSPMDKSTATFLFTDNRIGYANRNSLVTQLQHEVEVVVDNNWFQHLCDCSLEMYVFPLTGHSGLSSPFQDLSSHLLNTSYCRVSDRDSSCFSTSSSSMLVYQETLCLVDVAPSCTLLYSVDQVDQVDQDQDNQGGRMKNVYDDFLLLFQVKTTKGILLFLLFCVLSSVVILTICVGSIWIHRLYKRARLVRDNLSGSFQFNSGDEKQILYGSDQTTCHSIQEDEPQYAEIVEIHPPPRPPGSYTDNDDLEGTTLTDVTTLPKSTTTTLPSLGAGTMSLRRRMDDTLPCSGDERDKLLSGGRDGGRDSIRMSMSETSLTDEIMMALREKLNDPSLYCTVMDAKAGGGAGYKVGSGGDKEEELYCSPIYSDPTRLA